MTNQPTTPAPPGAHLWRRWEDALDYHVGSRNLAQGFGGFHTHETLAMQASSLARLAGFGADRVTSADGVQLMLKAANHVGQNFMDNARFDDIEHIAHCSGAGEDLGCDTPECPTVLARQWAYEAACGVVASSTGFDLFTYQLGQKNRLGDAVLGIGTEPIRAADGIGRFVAFVMFGLIRSAAVAYFELGLESLEDAA